MKNKINILLLFFYTLLIAISQLIIHINNTIPFIIILFISITILLLSSYIIIKYVEKINITLYPNEQNHLYAYILNFTILMIFGLLINYSKAILANKINFENDMIVSINEALTNHYTEHRSPIYSLLFAKLPLIFSGNNTSFLGLYYITFRSLFLSYIITDISTKNIIINIILLIYYICMPLSIHSELAILKDTPCGIFYALSIYLIYKTIYKTNIKNQLLYNIIIAFSLLFTTLMRPNAILLTFPLIIILFFIYKNHIISAIRIATIFIICYLVITIPIYNILNVERYDNTSKYIETMSLPIECIANVVKNHGENFNYSPRLRTFVNKMCDNNLSNMNRFDERECYESIKWNPNDDTKTIVDENLINAVKNTSYTDYLLWSIEVITKEPKLTIKQFCHHIKGLITKRYIKKRLVNKWYANIYYTFADFEIPILLLIFIIILLAKNPIYKGFNKTNFLLSIPILLYLIGTTIAMSMSSIYRYFMPFHITFPIYVLFNMYFVNNVGNKKIVGLNGINNN